MQEAFPEALVEGYALLVPAMPNDPKDRHVLAAAVRSGSHIMVTSNVRHFPIDKLKQFDIEAQAPDLFVLHQSNLDPKASAAILRGQAADKSNPPKRTSDVLDRLATNTPTFAQAMRLLLGLKTEGRLVRPVAIKLAALEAEIEAVRIRHDKAS